MNKVRWLVLCLILLTPLAGCSRGASGQEGSRGGLGLIKLNDITYMTISQATPMVPDEVDLSIYDTVKRKTEENVFRNGDAEGLEPGTPVYSIAGYSPSFRLAVRRSQELVFYQVIRNPHAQRGGDMLDIGGKVEYIGIRGWEDRFDVASITEQKRIDELVQMILEAPYSSVGLMNSGVKMVWLRFGLVDGTQILQGFWLDSGVMGTGIQVPQEFSAAIGQAIGAAMGEQRESPP